MILAEFKSADGFRWWEFVTDPPPPTWEIPQPPGAAASARGMFSQDGPPVSVPRLRRSFRRVPRDVVEPHDLLERARKARPDIHRSIIVMVGYLYEEEG
jgi:hypothetical protein